MNTVIIVAFVAILGSLAAALVFMLRGSSASADDDAQRGRRMARALTFRIGFSVALFLLVVLSYFMGWIQPTGLPLR